MKAEGCSGRIQLWSMDIKHLKLSLLERLHPEHYLKRLVSRRSSLQRSPDWCLEDDENGEKGNAE